MAAILDDSDTPAHSNPGQGLSDRQSDFFDDHAPPDVVTLQGLADILGITPRRVQQLADEGMPRFRRGQYRLAACVQWFITYKVGKETRVNGTSDPSTEREKLYQAQRERIELEIACRRQEVLDGEEVAAALHEIAVTFSTSLESLAGRVAAPLSGMTEPAEVQALVLAETRAIRSAVANEVELVAKKFEPREAE